jgi:TolB-like protein/DNA-binding winged helix-turn-helix (wHTH) protein/tetratricopeptide (TPR) repeat protein
VTAVEHPKVVRFGVFELDERARELRKKGARVRLQEQPFLVLAFLLERAGQVVTRDELRQRLWPSSVYVDFDHGLNNAIARLREALGDSASAPHFIETLPRHGYRFIYPLTPGVDSAEAPVAAVAKPAPVPAETAVTLAPERSRQRIPRSFALAAMAAVILLAGVLWNVQRTDFGTANALPGKAPSIAVVPFVNMSSEAENEHFADGLTDELIHTLASIRGLQVAGQTSSFYFKQQKAPPAEIAKALNVDHILEGSVRRAGSRIRVTAQLLDARDGYHRWSETFDRDVTDVLAIQEEIARNVATELKVQLLGVDEQRLEVRKTRNPDAYRHFLLARAHLSGVFVPRDWRVMKASYEAAIELDPEFADAHAGLALYYYNRERLRPDGVQRGLAAAERAVALDPDNAEGLAARAGFGTWRYFYLGDYGAYQRAQDDFRRATELEPSNALAYYNYGRAVQWTAPSLARDLIARTAELDPLRYGAVGNYASMLGRFGERERGERLIRELYERHNPRSRYEVAIFAGVLAYDFGRLDDAVTFTRESLPHTQEWLQLWRLLLTLGDTDGARDALMHDDSPHGRALRKAAGFVTERKYREAYLALERERAQFAWNRILDLPTARLAAIVGEDEAALSILEQRLPGLVNGTEPINAHNAMPAMDLAYAFAQAARSREARVLLEKIATFLDGPMAPRVPLFTYLRARAYALEHDGASAQRLLERAYDEGFRATWAPSLLPSALVYIDPIDADPAFAAIRSTAEYKVWLARIESDNARQLERLRARNATASST